MGLARAKIIRVALRRMRTDPKAWIKKYFRAASAEYKLNLEDKIGMNERRFSSSPSQVVNQELDETAIRIPRARDIPNKARLGFEFRIKKRRRSS